MLRTASLIASASLVLAGCDGSLGPIACTDIFAYGVTVRVEDADTGAPRADSATLTLTDGAYVEVVTTSFDGATLSGAGERAGTYRLVVERTGYTRWAADDVVVGADECHVIGVSLTALLQPLP
jgi:hypothetical protein